MTIKLVTRKRLLAQLGMKMPAPRWSWSHDLGESIAFDAWEDHWVPVAGKTLGRYPLRTNGQHYNKAKSLEVPRLGHTRWQSHVDLVAAGKRGVRALVPVRSEAGANARTKGWHPKVVEGTARTDSQGEVWFYADRVVEI
jgi:hypothetical protein